MPHPAIGGTEGLVANACVLSCFCLSIPHHILSLISSPSVLLVKGFFYYYYLEGELGERAGLEYFPYVGRGMSLLSASLFTPV